MCVRLCAIIFVFVFVAAGFAKRPKVCGKFVGRTFCCGLLLQSRVAVCAACCVAAGDTRRLLRALRGQSVLCMGWCWAEQATPATLTPTNSDGVPAIFFSSHTHCLATQRALSNFDETHKRWQGGKVCDWYLSRLPLDEIKHANCCTARSVCVWQPATCNHEQLLLCLFLFF